MAQLEQLFDALRDIESASGLNEKMARIKKESGNMSFRTLLRLAYSPFDRFQVSKLPDSYHSDSDAYCAADAYDEFLELTRRLSRREVTGNAAKDGIKAFFKKVPERHAVWYRRVLLKDLRIGVNDKSINKAIPDLIPTYNVMLANKITPEEFLTRDKKAMGKLPVKCAIQRKIDGYRMNIIKRNGDILMVSRNGLPIPGKYPGILKDAKNLPDNYVYDGEVVAPELFDWIARNEAKGGVTEQDRDLFAKAISSRAKRSDDKAGVFCLFDAVPIGEWDAQGQTAPYRERILFLNMNVRDSEFIQKVPVDLTGVTGTVMRNIWDLFETYNRVGWEGIMIKDEDAPYQWKRSNVLLKMKRMDTADLTVLRVEEGEGRNAGRLGAIIVDFNGNEVHVGSGFTDDERARYYLFSNLIVGHTVEVAYQAVTTNKKTNKQSLSFPVFKGIRTDK